MNSNKEIIKILMVLDAFHIGGAEMFCLNFVKNLDRKRFQVDFAVTNLTNNKLEEEIIGLGCKLHIIPRFKVFNIKNYKKRWNELLRKEHYDVIHGHASGAMSIYLSVAKKHGCVTFAHSHSAFIRGNIFVRTVKKLFSKGIKNNADYWLSCSDLAAIRLYGKDFSKSTKYHFIPNGIQPEKYKFNESYRKTIRENFKVSDETILIGHVGSFTEPKNHKYLLEVFKEFNNIIPESKLILCGDGPLKQSIEKMADCLRIKDKVIFTGNVYNTNEFYSAFDYFVFPSFFEGLPISLVEAQASGLPILCSDSITTDVILTSHIFQKSVSENESNWAQFIAKTINDLFERTADYQLVYKSVFTINSTVQIVTNLYCESISEVKKIASNNK